MLTSVSLIQSEVGGRGRPSNLKNDNPVLPYAATPHAATPRRRKKPIMTPHNKSERIGEDSHRGLAVQSSIQRRAQQRADQLHRITADAEACASARRSSTKKSTPPISSNCDSNRAPYNALREQRGRSQPISQPVPVSSQSLVYDRTTVQTVTSIALLCGPFNTIDAELLLKIVIPTATALSAPLSDSDLGPAVSLRQVRCRYQISLAHAAMHDIEPGQSVRQWAAAHGLQLGLPEQGPYMLQQATREAIHLAMEVYERAPSVRSSLLHSTASTLKQLWVENWEHRECSELCVLLTQQVALCPVPVLLATFEEQGLGPDDIVLFPQLWRVVMQSILRNGATFEEQVCTQLQLRHPLPSVPNPACLESPSPCVASSELLSPTPPPASSNEHFGRRPRLNVNQHVIRAAFNRRAGDRRQLPE